MWITSGFVDDLPPVSQLEEFLEQCSDPSFDRSKADELALLYLVITRPLIHRLLPLLQHDDVQMDHSPGTATATPDDIPALHFHSVHVRYCRFFSEADATTAEHNDNVCTADDKRSLLAALARLGTSLYFDNSGEILSALLSTPEIDHLEVPRFQICQEAILSNLELTRLGAMMERSVKTVDFTPEFHYVNVPDAFYDSLANCIHLQALHFGDHPAKIFPLSKVIAGEDGNGAVERLLRNPHNQLTTLELDTIALDDQHLIALAPSLAASKVKVLNLIFNNIHPPGLLEFAKHLANMRSLNRLWIRGNPWTKAPPKVRDECGIALLQAIARIPSITEVDDVKDFPQIGRFMCYFFSLNLGGRKYLRFSPSSSSLVLLSSSADGSLQEEQRESIPPGLWPHILARAGNRHLYNHIVRDARHNAKACVVYFFLRKYPHIFFKL